jgi:hypothetical protein
VSDDNMRRAFQLAMPCYCGADAGELCRATLDNSCPCCRAINEATRAGELICAGGMRELAGMVYDQDPRQALHVPTLERKVIELRAELCPEHVKPKGGKVRART